MGFAKLQLFYKENVDIFITYCAGRLSEINVSKYGQFQNIEKLNNSKFS
jgi:hypothetical protein